MKKKKAKRRLGYDTKKYLDEEKAYEFLRGFCSFFGMVSGVIRSEKVLQPSESEAGRTRMSEKLRKLSQEQRTIAMELPATSRQTAPSQFSEAVPTSARRL